MTDGNYEWATFTILYYSIISMYLYSFINNYKQRNTLTIGILTGHIYYGTI